MPEVITAKNAAILVLDSVQTLRTIEATKDILLQHLNSSSDLVLDCSQVDDADISIVQLLLAARATAARQGAALRLAAPSAALRAVLDRTGVCAAADDPFWNGAAP